MRDAAKHVTTVQLVTWIVRLQTMESCSAEDAVRVAR